MSNKFFSNIQKKFGFGFMRLPLKDGEIDQEEVCGTFAFQVQVEIANSDFEFKATALLFNQNKLKKHTFCQVR